MPAITSILHIEDDPLWAEVTAHLLDGWPEVRRIGSVAKGNDGIELCQAQPPQVVLLDLRLPDMSGFTVWEHLIALPRPPRILLLTSRADEALFHRVSLIGAGGLISKNGDFAEHLRPAIAAVATGGSYYSPDIAEAIRGFRGSPEAFFKILSPWELRLVSLLAHGHRDADIAIETGLSSGTIRNHWRNISGKLGLGDRHDLRIWAERKGFSLESSVAPSAQSFK